MSLPCPDEKRLKQLIAEAFGTLAAPDPKRLTHIESRLTRLIQRQPPRRKRPLWPWLLLLAGGMAAAWWGAERFMSNRVEPVDVKAPVVTAPATPLVPERAEDADPTTGEKQDGSTEDKPNHSIIYQREQY